MSAIDDLLEALKSKPSGYVPATNPFLQIDIESVAKELRLAELGAERGENNLPRSKAKALDDIEQQVTSRIENEARQSFIECENELRVIDNRLTGLDLTHRLSQVQSASSAATAEFHASARAWLNHLSELRRGVRQSQEFMNQFRSENGLTRPATEGSGAFEFWGLVSGAVVGEAAINSVFLSVNDEAGLLGGLATALAIAVINVLIAVQAGKRIFPYVNHVSTLKRVAGIMGLSLYAIVALSLNLLGAHYRVAKGAGVPHPEQAAMNAFVEHGVFINDFMSALLCLFGLVCAVAALAAGYRSDDEYPGYGRVARQHREILDEYSEGVEEAQSELQDIREKAATALHESNRAMTRDRREYEAALRTRVSILALYRQRHPQLQSAGNRLLSIYRNANISKRSTPPPEHFSNDWRLSEMAEPSSVPPPDLRSSFDEAQKAASDSLQAAVHEIDAAYMKSVTEFRQIDDLLGDP